MLSQQKKIRTSKGSSQSRPSRFPGMRYHKAHAITQAHGSRKNPKTSFDPSQSAFFTAKSALFSLGHRDAPAHNTQRSAVHPPEIKSVLSCEPQNARFTGKPRISRDNVSGTILLTELPPEPIMLFHVILVTSMSGMVWSTRNLRLRTHSKSLHLS